MLSYYSEQSIVTDLRSYSNFVEDLPPDATELSEILKGLLVHFNSGKLHGAYKEVGNKVNNRLFLVEGIIKEIDQLNNEPLHVKRKLDDQLVCTARDFSVLLCSILREKKIAARARCGFASYLGTDYYTDHWICEHWIDDEQKWRKVDCLLDKNGNKLLNTEALETGRFLESGVVWQMCRQGQLDAKLFGYENKRGFGFIRSNMLRDFAALNKAEVNSWSVLWGYKTEQDLKKKDYDELDVLSNLIIENSTSFESIRQKYEEELWISGPVNTVINQKIAGDSGREHSIETSENRIVLSNQVEQRKRFIEKSNIQNYNVDSNVIHVKGAKQHNLKNIDISIPKNKLVVITGVSGSGKSSLAFDTIYSESQRRFMSGLSLYVRKFMMQMQKPKVDFINGLNPSIAIEQKTLSNNPRSTVGTVTEISNYLRLLYSRIGKRNCTHCGYEVSPLSPVQIANALLSHIGEREEFHLLAPVVLRKIGNQDKILERYLSMGYRYFRINGIRYDLVDTVYEWKEMPYTVEAVCGTYVVPEGGEENRKRFVEELVMEIRRVMRLSNYILNVLYKGKELLFSSKSNCPNCHTSFPELSAQHFSPNSPLGMCDECKGIGITQKIEPELLVHDENLSIVDGAIKWFGNLKENNRSSWPCGPLDVIYEHYGLDINTPWKDLPESFHNVIFYGSGSEKIEMTSILGMKSTKKTVKGLVPELGRLFFDSDSKTNRERYSVYMDQRACNKCNGSGLCNEAYHVTLGGYRVSEISNFSIDQALMFVVDLYETIDEIKFEIAKEILIELYNRFSFLKDVGLHYLSINRTAPTLSGGEGQRVRLASQLSSGIVGVLYVLDEPSIGLHPKDNSNLISTLLKLRDIGNSVLVVEHDEEIMKKADWLIDIGPKAGVNGGQVISQGSPTQVMQDANSLTGKYLKGSLKVDGDKKGGSRELTGDWIVLNGATLHNLKNVTARIPIGRMTCVTGVSGSGKSSLIAGTLEPLLERLLNKANVEVGPYKSIEGIECLNKVINISQKPIGKSPRSNPATYTKVFDEIRKVFASSEEAALYNMKYTDFSFNSSAGRCDVCEGHGQVKIEMHFLPDVWITCRECNGKRFNSNILRVKYKGKSISEVLEMDISEAITFFEGNDKINKILDTLSQVGLDYIKLGQSATTFSGGEAQRIKLAKELSKLSKGNVVYVLDEPTTGLHFHDVQQLLRILHNLVELGKTIIIIEHNLDVVKTADWIIDLGFEGGVKGGEIVAQCTPKELMDNPNSYTGVALREHAEYFEKHKVSNSSL